MKLGVSWNLTLITFIAMRFVCIMHKCPSLALKLRGMPVHVLHPPALQGPSKATLASCHSSNAVSSIPCERKHSCAEDSMTTYENLKN